MQTMHGTSLHMRRYTRDNDNACLHRMHTYMHASMTDTTGQQGRAGQQVRAGQGRAGQGRTGEDRI